MPVLQQSLANQSPLLPRYFSYYRGQQVILNCRDHILALQLPDAPQQQWHWNPDSGSLAGHKNPDYPGLLCALECLFGQMPALKQVTLQIEPSLQSVVAQCGAGHRSAAGEFIVTPGVFWQLGKLWVSHGGGSVYPQHLVVSNAGYRHPRRPAKPSGTVYRRFIPWLKRTLSFRTLNIDKDLELFHRWMHCPRVEEFWQQADSREELEAYLQDLQQDAHCQTLLGYIDDTPFSYFEIYWAKEDRLSPHYSAGGYDRGWHLLVGEEAFRGRPWFTAWFLSLQHYLFLDDPRTQHIVAEPRHDNARLIRNARRSGFDLVKTFDFPHKRAQLIMLLREKFFQGNYIHPQGDEENPLDSQ